MRVPYILGVTAASLVVLTSVANAQYADRRDLFDPFGMSSEYQMNQQPQIFSPGPPSKTGAHFGSRYSNTQYMNDGYGYGYDEQMQGRRWR